MIHPADPDRPIRTGDTVLITSAMVTLAYTVINGPDHDRRAACRALAELILEATEP